MAWVEQQKSGKYRAMYRVGKKRRSAGTFTKEKEALREAWAAEDDARRDPLRLDPRDGRTEWGVYVEDWWARRTVEASTANRDLSRRKKHLDPVWGSVPLNLIRREDVERWLIDLERQGLAPATVIRCYTLLASSLRSAVVERRISVSPCNGIKLRPPNPGSERFLARDEAARIAAVMAEPYRTLYLLLLGTGMRWGEAAGLHWNRVDLDAGHIDVIESYDQIIRVVKPYGKTRKRRRVWLADWVVEALNEHRERFTPQQRCEAPHRHDAPCRSGLVVPGARGGVVEYASFHKRHWGRAVGRPMWEAVDGPEPGRLFANPSAARKVKGFENVELRPIWEDGLAEIGPARVHDLRHSYASWLVQSGVPLYDVAQQLGHSHTSVSTRYGHLADSSRGRVLSALAWQPDEQDAGQTKGSPCPESA